MRKLIGIDSGKYDTKAVAYQQNGTEKVLVFRTKLEETQRTEAQGKSYIVEYAGKRYLVGEQAETNSAKSSKAENLHRIATYTALHQLTNTCDEIVVAIGCPLSVYENPESRNAYRDFMFPSKQITVKVGDTTKYLTVCAVVVMPESSGVIYLEPEMYSKSLIGVIDVGGLNINCCTYNKTVPVLSTLYTDNLGSNILTQNLKNALSVKYSEDIPQWMMDSILTAGFIRDNTRADGIREGSREFIADFKKKHVEMILKKCQANGWNLNLMDLVFTGGTSEMLRDDIKSVLPGATVYKDAAMANVRGFLKAITD